MAATKKRIRKEAKNVTKDLHKMANVARNGARRSVRNLRANAADRLAQGRDKAHQVEHHVVQYIRDRPVKSALIAAGVGLVFGGVWIHRLMTSLARTKHGV